MDALNRLAVAAPRKRRYEQPAETGAAQLADLLAPKRWPSQGAQLTLVPPSGDPEFNIPVYFAGDVSLLQERCVSIVGTREPSDQGVRRARKLARELVASRVVVVSGLAKGIDTVAHTSASHRLCSPTQPHSSAATARNSATSS